MKAINYILLLLSACFTHAEVIDLTVLIHGTVGSVCLMHHRKLAHKKWSELSSKWGAQWQQVYRQQPILRHFWPMQDFGLQMLDQQKLTAWHTGIAHSDDYKFAIYPIALAFDSLHISSNKKLYASFGWTGILHDELRTLASQELYAQLCGWKDSVIAQGDEPRVHLVAHSHGGNVALKLAGLENSLKRGLSIETLVMWGTPIQEETIYFAESPFFKTIINCYSPYDIIQMGDAFSTKNGRSKQRLHDKIDCASIQKKHLNSRRVDIELQVNGSSISVDHANLWILGKSQSLSVEINHLPYMLFSPIIKELIHACDSVHMHADLVTSKTKIQITVHDKKKNIRHESHDLKNILDHIHTTIISLWTPDEKHSGMLFSKANPLNFLFRRNKN
jgi:hypothetical protein